VDHSGEARGTRLYLKALRLVKKLSDRKIGRGNAHTLVMAIVVSMREGFSHIFELERWQQKPGAVGLRLLMLGGLR